MWDAVHVLGDGLSVSGEEERGLERPVIAAGVGTSLVQTAMFRCQGQRTANQGCSFTWPAAPFSFVLVLQSH